MVDVAVVITAGRLHCRGRGRERDGLSVCLLSEPRMTYVVELPIPSQQRTTIDLRRNYVHMEHNKMEVIYITTKFGNPPNGKIPPRKYSQDVQEFRSETDSLSMDRVSKELDEKKYSRRP